VGLIKGNIHFDERGKMRFVNDFDMSAVVRMYCIEPNLGVVRAWQGHKVERKWFYAVKGRFLVKTVEMGSLNKVVFELTSTESKVLQIEGGCFNGFEALEEGSVLMVFSDFSVEDSKNDDYRETIENINW
jgi:dTDP-4-dehydrorhamnose 3,5-epimerase-like enzyme